MPPSTFPIITKIRDVLVRLPLASAISLFWFTCNYDHAFGAGFAVPEQNASGLAVANSNGAEAKDASTVWLNPAGMANLPNTPDWTGSQGVIGMNPFLLVGEFDNDPTRSTNSGGGPAAGGNGGNFGIDTIIPVMYGVYEWENIFFGLGLGAPFGNGSDYDDGWVGRYYALESRLLTVNANPSVAVPVGKYLSVGAGLNILYGDFTLSQAIDTGAFAGAFASDDSTVSLVGDGFGYGYNFGLMFFPNERFRAGISYRSSVKHSFDGRASFDLSASGMTVSGNTGALVDTGISSEVRWPDTLSIHGFYQATNYLALMADLTWTNWSTIKSIPIVFDNPAQPAQSLGLKYHDTWRLSLGASYKLNNEFELRFGGSFDQSPQPDATRSFRLPDDDRWILGFGATYTPNSRMTFNLGYQMVYVEETDVDVTTPTGAGTSNRAAGTSNMTAHMFAIEAVIKF